MSTTAMTSLGGFHATESAQRADELVRAYFEAVNVEDPARVDALLDRSFLSYDVHGTRSRTALKRYHADLRGSFSDLRFDVHENVGVLVEGDLVALRTIITGSHTGAYAGVAATGNAIQTSPRTSSAFATTVSSSTGQSSTPTASWSRSARSPRPPTRSSRSWAWRSRLAGCSRSGAAPSSAGQKADL
jgi:predicted ester cyclase